METGAIVSPVEAALIIPFQVAIRFQFHFSESSILPQRSSNLGSRYAVLRVVRRINVFCPSQTAYYMANVIGAYVWVLILKHRKDKVNDSWTRTVSVGCGQVPEETRVMLMARRHRLELLMCCLWGVTGQSQCIIPDNRVWRQWNFLYVSVVLMDGTAGDYPDDSRDLWWQCVFICSDLLKVKCMWTQLFPLFLRLNKYHLSTLCS